MSLLSGIRFVQKKERENIPLEDSDSDSGKKKHTKKKHKHHHSKDKKKVKESKYKQYDDLKLESKSDMLSMIPDGYDSEEDMKKRRKTSVLDYDPMEKFLSKKSIASTSKPIQNDFDYDNYKNNSNHKIDDFDDASESSHDDSIELEDATVATIETKTMQPTPLPILSTSNQSVAEQLRAKLKKNQPLVTSVLTNQTKAVSCFSLDDMSHQDAMKLKQYVNESKISSKSTLNSTTITPAINDSSTIQEMLHNERSNKLNMDDIFVKNVLRLGDKYKGTELGSVVNAGNSSIISSEVTGRSKTNASRSGMDEDDYGEVDMSMFASHEDKSDKEVTMKKMLARMQKQSQAQQMIFASCYQCLQSRTFKSYQTISTGVHTMLRLKPVGLSLAPGWHCEIVPIEHFTSIRSAGDDVMLEVERYKRCLLRMFADRGKGFIAMESAVQITNNRIHCVIDVLPLDIPLIPDVKIYFKEALSSGEEKWITHKKVISTHSNSKPLYGTVPLNMAYIAVEWSDASNDGMEDGMEGYVHVVEHDDKRVFTSEMNSDFCLDIICGIVDDDDGNMRLKRQRMGRVGKGSSGSSSASSSVSHENEEKKMVKKFQSEWDKYDWTGYAV